MNGLDRTLEQTDLNLLRVFEVVFRLGSLTSAAKSLGLTQPAVSNAIRRLREQIGDPLFVRDGRLVAPTPVARLLAPDIAHALRIVDTSLAKLRGFDANQTTRRFKLGLNDSLERPLLPNIIAAIHGLAPAAIIESIPSASSDVPGLLARGEIDLGITAVVPHERNIRHEVVLKDDVRVAMRKGHPLSKSPLTVQRWLAARHLVVTGQTRGPTPEDVAIERLGLKRNVAVRCQSYGAAAELIAESSLVAVVPASFGAWFDERGDVVTRAFPFEVPPLEIAVYWSLNSESDLGSIWFKDRVVEVLKAVSGQKHL